MIDLLPRALPDVGEIQVAVRAVEREAPRIAQPVRGDLPRGPSRERVRPEDLAEADRQVLRAVAGVAGGAPVTHADVQAAVRPELQLAAVMVPVRLLHEQQPARARDDRLAVPRAELDDARVAVQVGVVDVEAMVLLVARAERHREQPTFAPARDARADVEERPGDAPADEVPDAARLLDDVEAVRLGRRRRDVRRRVEAARVLTDRHGRRRDRPGSADHREDHTAARSSARTHGPGGISSCSTCRYANPTSGASVQRSMQTNRGRHSGKNFALKLWSRSSWKNRSNRSRNARAVRSRSGD